MVEQPRCSERYTNYLSIIHIYTQRGDYHANVTSFILFLFQPHIKRRPPGSPWPLIPPQLKTWLPVLKLSPAWKCELPHVVFMRLPIPMVLYPIVQVVDTVCAPRHLQSLPFFFFYKILISTFLKTDFWYITFSAVCSILHFKFTSLHVAGFCSFSLRFYFLNRYSQYYFWPKKKIIIIINPYMIFIFDWLIRWGILQIWNFWLPVRTTFFLFLKLSFQ